VNFRLKIKPAAENDAAESALWYNGQKANLGSEFLEEIGAVLNLIKNNPFLFQEKYRKLGLPIPEDFPTEFISLLTPGKL